jgi:hypothetical protein
MKDDSNRVVTLGLVGWLCFAVALAGWFQDASALAVAATVWRFKFGWIMDPEGNRVELWATAVFLNLSFRAKPRESPILIC